MSLLAPVRPAFRAIASTVVPEAALLDDDAWEELERTVENALGTRSPAMQRQLVLFVRVLNVLALLTRGATRVRLAPARRARLLASVERSPVPVLRKGFWGLRTLVYMGYYTRPAVHAGIGYRAHVRGWSHRRALGTGGEPGGGRGVEPPRVRGS